MGSVFKDVKLAKNHKIVHEIVREQGKGIHLTMPEVHELARHRIPSIGFTTVYRALVRLRGLGLIAEIVLPGSASAYYEAIAEPHAHFRCDHCGSLADLEYAPPARSIKMLSEQHGIEIRETVLSFHGRCKACRKTKRAASHSVGARPVRRRECQ